MENYFMDLNSQFLKNNKTQRSYNCKTGQVFDYFNATVMQCQKNKKKRQILETSCIKTNFSLCNSRWESPELPAEYKGSVEI